MKNLIFMLLLTATLSGRAQNFEPRTPEGARGQPEEHMPAIDQWLNTLQASNPAEYERLTALRRDDPKAFQEDVRRKWDKQKSILKLKNEHPKIFQALETLSPEDRQWLMGRLEGKGGKPGGDGTERPPGQGGPNKAPGFMPPEQQQEIKELADQWRAEPDAEAKKAIREELKLKLTEGFAKMEKDRLRQIEDLENRVKQMRSEIERRAKNQDQQIERRLNEILGGKTPKPPSAPK